MSNSVFSKSAFILNAIAITIALAVISGYMPLNFSPMVQIQSLLNQISLNRR